MGWLLVLPLLGLVSLGLPAPDALAAGFSLRFHGNGVNDIDRVKVLIDPQNPADVGFDLRSNSG